MDGLAKTYIRLQGRSSWIPDPELAAELEALLRYRQAIQLAAHHCALESTLPSRPGVPLEAATEDARRWLARAHKVVTGDTRTVMRAVVLDDLSLGRACRRVGQCSLTRAERLLRDAADKLRAIR